MAGHHTRFERWRAKLPKHTRYLVDQVLTRIVPEFEARGFKWYDDFAGGDPKEIGYNEIPLQRREGEQWPTVQISFDKRRRPAFHIDFTMLPPICRRWGIDELHPWTELDVPREKAIVVYGPAYFMLCRGKYKNLDGEFGHAFSVVNLFFFLPMLIAGLISRDLRSTLNDIRFIVSPHRFLEAEVSKAVALLPVLFDLFDKGIPEAWLTHEFGYVDKHVMLMGSWYLHEKQRAKASARALPIT